MNNLVASESENKLDNLNNNYNNNQFEEKYFQDSITFNEYDSLESQLKIFFGRYFDSSENTFYPDLSIVKVSDSLREMYRFKLNEMAIDQIFYKIHK